MAWLNTGYRRRDIVGGVVKHQWVALQPSGAKFSNDHNDPNVYLNGVVVDPLLAVYYDIPNEAGAVNPPLNGRLGEYITVAQATAAPTTFGTGTIEVITVVARGRKHIVADTMGRKVAEYDTRTGKTTALGVDLGPHDNLAEALADITTALQTGTPTESPDGTVVPDDEDEIYDSDLNKWHINADPLQGFVGAVFKNNANTWGVADWLLYLDSIVYHHNPNTGHFYHLVGTDWIDDGITDPRLPTPSADWFTVPDDGAFLIGDDGIRYELGTAAGSGFNILKGGALWAQPNGGGAWGDKIKIGNGTPPRLIDHRNPSGLGWIHPTGNTWTAPHADHEGTPPEPQPGTTTGTISGGSLHQITLADTTGFAVGDDIFVEPLTREGQGPGGQWPFTIFANAAARNAGIGSLANFQHVGQLDDGWVYAAIFGAYERLDGALGGKFYQSRIRSLGHWARITSLAGNVATLNRTAQKAVTNAIVHWDGAPTLHAALQNASNGSSTANRTVLNANSLFPGRASVALCGNIVPSNKHNIRFTSNSRDSIIFYSPPGAPSCSFQWVDCTGIIDELVGKRGNWTPADYGMGWQGSTVPGTAGYLGDIPTAGQVFPAGTQFWGGNNNIQRDQTVTDVPIRAGGGQFTSSIHVQRVKNIMTAPIREYIQWQFQFDACDDVWFEDCEVDSVAAIPAFELFKCTGGGIVRPKGRNALIAVNGSGGGWVLDSPNLIFDPGCMVALEPWPAWNQYANGTRAININHNIGTALVGGGGTITNPVVTQQGYLDTLSRNIAAMEIQDLLPNVVCRGGRFNFPAVRVAGGGAVGIISRGPNARFSDCIVVGEAAKTALDYNFMLIDAIDEGGLICDPGGKVVNWVIT